VPILFGKPHVFHCFSRMIFLLVQVLEGQNIALKVQMGVTLHREISEKL